MLSAALIMSFIKSSVNWVKFDINNVLNQGNILYERSVNYLHSTNYPIDGRDYLLVTNIVRETILFNRKITFKAASCYSFTGRGKKVKRDEIAFGFVFLSQTLNRLVEKYQFIILIANESASSITHHDGAFFLFDPHSMDQNKKYFLNGVSCMLLFNALVGLIKCLQANKICNNSILCFNGVNISVENITDVNSDNSTTRKNDKCRLSKIVNKESLRLSKKNKKIEDEKIIPDENNLGILSTDCEHCQATFYEKETKHKQSCEFRAVKEYERIFNNFSKFIKDLSIDEKKKVYALKSIVGELITNLSLQVISVKKEILNTRLSNIWLHGEAKRPGVGEDIRNKDVYAFNEISVIDYLIDDEDNEEAVKKKELNFFSSNIDSRRFMHLGYQDGMVIVKKFRKPDFFITITTNPNWREITENLYSGQLPNNCHDLIARVLKHKSDVLIHDLKKNKIMGNNDFRLISDQVDKCVKAEFPDKEKNLRLFKIVTKTMVHSRCDISKSKVPC
uniref:Helitron_like_N domain-containing protein n=1 Tax=Strongyloides venezuelensis TaxID=75913 RepID=A0A0K0FED6_STRVS